MGRAAVLGELYPMARRLRSPVPYGRLEAQPKTAIGGLGDAAGVKLDTDAVGNGYQ